MVFLFFMSVIHLFYLPNSLIKVGRRILTADWLPSSCIQTRGLCFEQSRQLCVRLCTGLTDTLTQVSFPNFGEVH